MHVQVDRAVKLEAVPPAGRRLQAASRRRATGPFFEIPNPPEPDRAGTDAATCRGIAQDATNTRQANPGDSGR